MKIRITGSGIYSVYGGGFRELPIGAELNVGKIPMGWESRCVVVADEAGKEPVMNPETNELDELRAKAEAAGVSVDRRWGVERLKEEIEAA